MNARIPLKFISICTALWLSLGAASARTEPCAERLARLSPTSEELQKTRIGDWISFQLAQSRAELLDLKVTEILRRRDGSIEEVVAFNHRSRKSYNLKASQLVPGTFKIRAPASNSVFKRQFPINYPILSRGDKPLGASGLYLWQVAPQGPDGPRASLFFEVSSHSRKIYIKRGNGSKELKGAVTYLKARLGELYPGYSFVSSLSSKNAQRIYRAFRDAVKSGLSPEQAAFEKVPSLAAVDGPFKMRASWSVAERDPYFTVEQLIPEEGATRRRQWLNADDLLMDPRFKRWLEELPHRPEQDFVGETEDYLDDIQKADPLFIGRDVKIYP